MDSERSLSCFELGEQAQEADDEDEASSRHLKSGHGISSLKSAEKQGHIVIQDRHGYGQ